MWCRRSGNGVECSLSSSNRRCRVAIVISWRDSSTSRRQSPQEECPMADAYAIFDPLYGPIEFSPEMAELIAAPIVQRLRGIRLSNIDSVAMPGLAGVTRFEHSLGVLHIASRTRASFALSEGDRLVLQAAALLHDSLIP